MCLLLVVAGPAVARQSTTTTAPAAASTVRTYAECTRVYATRRDVASYCQRLFPATPVITSYDTCVEAMGRTADARKLCAQRYPDGAPKPAEPVDVTPQVNKLIDSWFNRPKPPKPPPADPLAVIPGIQAACAQWVGDAARWRRCAADGWRDAGLRGKPPLVLQTPPLVDRPPVQEPPVVVEPTDQTPVKPPPVRPDPPPIVDPAVPEPPIVIQSDRPIDVAPPPEPSRPEPPKPKIVDPPLPPAPEASSIPVWAWVLAAVIALVAAGAGGFGLSRWLARARPPPVAPPCAPQIALVADPGVVVLTPDGPPRAGMAVSMRVALGDSEGEVRLDYPTLETAP